MNAALVTFLIENQCNFASLGTLLYEPTVIINSTQSESSKLLGTLTNSDDTVFCKKLFQVTMYVQY